MDQLPLGTACASVYECGFSLFSHLQTQARSFPHDAPSFQGEETAFERHPVLAVPAPVA